MIGMPGSVVIGSCWPKARTDRTGLKHRHRPLAGLRFVTRIGFSISLGLAVALVGPRLAAYQTAEPSLDCPAAQTRINLVFIIDRSGSLANRIDPPHEKTTSGGRGQTYNVEIEGVRCALLNPSVIPRDGSVSVGIVMFDGAASVPLPLTPRIRSDADAQVLALQVEAFRCVEIDPPCTSGDTNFDVAISEADRIAQSGPADRRLLIMSTDGEATDVDKGRGASAAFIQQARKDGVEAELDVILIGLRDDELDKNIGIAGGIVFPSPHTDLPGAVEDIKKSACNEPGNADFGADCDCQVRQFADFTRRALRSNVASRELTVRTADDPDPNTPVLAGSPLSLRQAIEMANANGGRTTITFASSPPGKTIQIHPRVPLPPLTVPDITICGCTGGCVPSIPDKLTCPQTSQSVEDGCDRMVTIDGQGKLADGILIRSNRGVVRGLRIINFSHAGIVVQPVCPSDNTGFNRIELNILENNTSAGVCVLDPPRGQVFAVTHNIGNTISMNDISGSGTPIDLACDGPTQNDDGDLDEGPNTLLNHPQPFTAVTAGNTVTVTGMVTIPKVDCPIYDKAVVEVFAVTKIHPESSKAVVDAVTFFRRIFVDEMKKGGFSQEFKDSVAFSVTLADGPASPIDGYTATFTDRAGNTSELIRFCTGPPKPKLSTQSITFGEVKRVDPSGEPSSNPQSQSFTIENCGCSKLDLSLVSIERGGKDVGRLVNLNDSAFKKGSGFFSVKQINATGEPIPISIPKNNIAIDPGKSQRFSVEFNPVIPRVIKGDEEKSTGGLFAKHVLPADLMSALNFQQTGSGDLLTIRLTGHVTTAVKLIDPDTPTNTPKVTLTRSGDEFIVTFAVFDSNLDVNHLSFQFFDKAGQTVPLELPDDDLTQVIRERRLVTGQSFIIIKRFSNAKKHKEVGSVLVKVSDGETTVSATSGAVVSLTSTASAQSLRDGRAAVLLLPTVRLRPALDRNVQGAALPRPAVKRLMSSATGAPYARGAIFKKRSRTHRNAHGAE